MNRPALYCAVSSAILVWCIVFGTFTLYAHNNLLPYIYFIFAVYVIIGHKGLVKVNNDLMTAAWMLLALLPVPFLLYYQDVMLVSLNVFFFWGFFVLRTRLDCEKSSTKWCLLSKK